MGQQWSYIYDKLQIPSIFKTIQPERNVQALLKFIIGFERDLITRKLNNFTCPQCPPVVAMTEFQIHCLFCLLQRICGD